LLLVLPLLIAASESAQALLDRFTSSAYQGAELLRHAQAGHLAPELGALGLVLVACGFVGHVASGSRRRSLSAWTFALVPLLLFVVQENVEYGIAHGQLAGTVSTQPAFLLGLALQLPFALAAYLAARLLVGLAATIAERLAAAPRLAGRLESRRLLYRDPPRPGRCGLNAGLTRGPPLRSAH
jgi:hypothetical protein